MTHPNAITPAEALRLALEALDEKIKPLNFEANVYDSHPEMGHTEAARSSEQRRRLQQAKAVLREQHNDVQAIEKLLKAFGLLTGEGTLAERVKRVIAYYVNQVGQVKMMKTETKRRPPESEKE